jgi:cytosine/adenosine deaminase-related metal-dependent hydrolase
LIHGVGITQEDWVRITKTGAGLVWCPASNVFLLEKTVPIRSFLDSAGPESVALGTDSRLTGSRDLLEEMQMAREIGNVTPQEILGMVTANAARLLRISRAGKLSIGFPADLVIIPPLSDDPFEALLACVRKHVLLVMVNGQPRYGAVGMSEVFGACGVKAVPIRVDGEDKLLGYPFARQLQKCSIKEPGVD